MISTDITGNNAGASQLLDLLSLVANPQVYEAKVKALQELTDKNQKYVEAVGPASEILKLREEAGVDREEAAKTLAAAKAESAKIVAQAKETAAKLTKSATASAAEKKAAAQKLLDDAQAEAAEVESSRKGLAKAQADVEKQKVQLATALKQAKSAKAALAKSKSEVETLRSELRKKLDAFAKAADL